MLRPELAAPRPNISDVRFEVLDNIVKNNNQAISFSRVMPYIKPFHLLSYFLKRDNEIYSGWVIVPVVFRNNINHPLPA